MAKVQKKQSKFVYGINEIVKEVKDNIGTNFTREEVKIVINTLLDTIDDKLQEGQDINFVGYFSFSTRKQPARKMLMRFGKKKGQEVKIPAKTVPAFKFSSAFRKRIVDSQ